MFRRVNYNDKTCNFIIFLQELFAVTYHISIKDEDIGSYIIQQNVRGKPVSVFRFPPRTKMRAATNITVSNMCNTLVVLLRYLEILSSNALINSQTKSM